MTPEQAMIYVAQLWLAFCGSFPGVASPMDLRQRAVFIGGSLAVMENCANVPEVLLVRAALKQSLYEILPAIRRAGMENSHEHN